MTTGSWRWKELDLRALLQHQTPTMPTTKSGARTYLAEQTLIGRATIARMDLTTDSYGQGQPGNYLHVLVNLYRFYSQHLGQIPDPQTGTRRITLHDLIDVDGYTAPQQVQERRIAPTIPELQGFPGVWWNIVGLRELVGAARGQRLTREQMSAETGIDSTHALPQMEKGTLAGSVDKLVKMWLWGVQSVPTLTFHDILVVTPAGPLVNFTSKTHHPVQLHSLGRIGTRTTPVAPFLVWVGQPTPEQVLISEGETSKPPAVDAAATRCILSRATWETLHTALDRALRSWLTTEERSAASWQATTVMRADLGQAVTVLAWGREHITDGAGTAGLERWAQYQVPELVWLYQQVWNEGGAQAQQGHATRWRRALRLLFGDEPR